MRFWTWLIARLMVALLVVGGAYCVFVLPSSGEEELHRAIDALKRVRAVHYSMVADTPSQHTEEQADLVCADDSFRRVTHIVLHQNGEDIPFEKQVLRSHGQDYRSQDNSGWMQESSGLEAAELSCKSLQQGNSAWVVPDLNQMLEHGVIEKGDKKKVDGAVCREWKVTTRAGDYFEHRTLCIGVDDHLPKEMQGGDGARRWTYAFDIPIRIEPPTNLVP